MTRVFRTFTEALEGFAPCALTIGNFDGVHAGHRELMRRVRAQALRLGVKPSVLTFHPHPAKIVAHERAPRLLSTPEERVALMEAEAIEQVFVLPFDAGVANLSAEEFVRAVVVETLGARAVTVGGNFHFGKKQAGDTDLLRRLGERHGFEVEVVQPIVLRGAVVSSSEVRRLLGCGLVAKAARLLERPYSVSGAVVRGEGRGSKQTVPTLNLETRAEVLPHDGVYITRTRDLDQARCWTSITNIGMRPTFEGRHLTIETFLLDPLAGETPERIRVEFLRRIRSERKFESAAALKAQILADIGRAHAYFRRTSVLRSR